MPLDTANDPERGEDGVDLIRARIIAVLEGLFRRPLGTEELAQVESMVWALVREEIDKQKTQDGG